MRTTLENNRAYSVRHHQARYSHTTKTLTGAYSMSSEGSTFQFLNPGGSDRTVFLPPYTPEGGAEYWLANTGTGTLTVVDANGVSVGSIAAGVNSVVFETLNGWRIFLDSFNKQDKVGTARLPSAAATVTFLSSDIELGIDTTAQAVSVNLPLATTWAAANPNGLELVIFDNTGHADTHNITPVVNGADVFVGGQTPLVTGPFGLIKIRPVPGTGWYLRQ